ncbi:lysis protein [Escherichia coli]|nr:lysis protein [Escherichia coli]
MNATITDMQQRQRDAAELDARYTKELADAVTNGAIVIHTQRLKSDPGGNLLS